MMLVRLVIKIQIKSENCSCFWFPSSFQLLLGRWTALCFRRFLSGHSLLHILDKHLCFRSVEGGEKPKRLQPGTRHQRKNSGAGNTMMDLDVSHTKFKRNFDPKRLMKIQVAIATPWIQRRSLALNEKRGFHCSL